MNEWHVLVTYALDVVFTKSVVKQSWTFHRFHRHDSGAVSVLELVTGAKGARRTGRSYKTGQPCIGQGGTYGLKDSVECVTRDKTMYQVVGKFRKLVDDDVLWITRELLTFIVDLFNVALCAGCAHNVFGIVDPFFQPAESFPTHAFWQYSNAMTAENAGNRDSAPAVVASRWPDCTMMAGVECTADQSWDQTAVCSQNFVCTNHRESVAQSDDDLCIDTGQCFW